MFIEVQETPNPNTLKFLLDTPILKDSQTYHFSSINEAKAVSPLAHRLFEIVEVKGVYLGYDFVTVLLNNEDQWTYLKPKVLAYITDFISSGAEPLSSAGEEAKQVFQLIGKDEKEQEIINKIAELFEERIRPAVAMDGGDITLASYEEGVVGIIMRGSCSGCPSSTLTLKNGIENMLKYYIPEIKEVVNIG
ncbi:NifU family protein [Candidatus Hepatincolaceae symbiont of Richtersius coronifer]